MPIARDPSLEGLHPCDCCQGISHETPVRTENRPGLPVVASRIGTHARFLQSMLAQLSLARHPSLHALKTRDTDDPTIALLDACAAVDDVLTFYQERYGQEAYLRTATERVSLVHLARLIGYEPRPGVAANAYLAFTIEDTPGTPEKVTLEARVRVQSIPGTNELPQTFETEHRIEARSLWNAMRLRTRQPHPLTTVLDVVTAKGIETGVKRGDSLLIVASADPSGRAVKRVKRVTPDPATQMTRIELDAPPPPSPPVTNPMVAPFFFDVTQWKLTSGAIGSKFHGRLYNQSDAFAFAAINNWSQAHLTVSANTPKPAAPESPELGIFALRRRAAIFGHNAPRWAALPQVVDGRNTLVTGKHLSATDRSKAQHPTDWDHFTLSQSQAEAKAGSNSVDLDNTYPEMVKGSWLVLESPTVSPSAYRIEGNQELTRSDFTLSVKVTRLTLDGSGQFDKLTVRETTALGQSESLDLADVPVTDPFFRESVVLDKYYPGLTPGRLVVLTGQRGDLNGVTSSEVRTLKEVQIDGTLEGDKTGRLFTRLVFDRPLDFVYLPETVTINANVALATHGETTAEVLGSGSARQRRPSFALKHAPLTYTSAPTPTGTASSLEVRVNDILWREVPNLVGLAPDEHVYITRIEEDGKARVQFNPQLPTGQENITARYRKGIGTSGLVHADQLTLLAVRPLGLRGVTNPLPASGAENPENLEAVRRNAPLGVLAMDRLVSLQDYEDFARAFAGFAKAKATLTVDGERQGVFVTVAGANGAEVGETSPEYRYLLDAMKRFGDPNVSFIVKSYRKTFFQVEANIAVNPAYLPEKVVEAVREALRFKFSFEKREFGQSVTKSEVMAAIQNVPGVVFLDLDTLFRTNPLPGGSEVKTLEDRLTAAVPRPRVRSTEASPAELLTLDPRPVQIGVLTP